LHLFGGACGTGTVHVSLNLADLVDGYSALPATFYQSLLGLSASGRPIEFTGQPFQMSKPTHIIRFFAEEDNNEHLGQLVDTTRDIGLDILEGRKVQAYNINGTIFDGEVSNREHILTVKQLLSPIRREQCDYVRCLGLNYIDHAKVSPSAAPPFPHHPSPPRD
jgi:hypothetical protein